MRNRFTAFPMALTMVATAICAPHHLSAQETRAQQVEWLDQHLVGDLAGLGRMIGDAEVVFLGEATHGDGTTFSQKVEICRYLHQKHGFSVIVFESGFYECDKAWQEIRDGRDPTAAATDAVFSVWTKSAQVLPLWRYIGEHASSEAPLELAGFDFQPSGVYTKTHLLADLDAAATQWAKELRESPEWSDLATPLELLEKGDWGKLRTLPEESRAAFQAAMERLAAALLEGAPFLGQVARSHARYMQFLWNFVGESTGPEVFNWREEQGAENLLWLRKHRYPGRKMIVWGATSHLSRNRQMIETANAPKMVPVGHHVAHELGKKLFILGFLAHHGRAAVARSGGPGFDIEPAPLDSFADLLGETSRESGFLDLRSARWLHEQRVARPMGHSAMKADWSQVVDAFYFMREMRPSEVSKPSRK